MEIFYWALTGIVAGLLASVILMQDTITWKRNVTLGIIGALDGGATIRILKMDPIFSNTTFEVLSVVVFSLLLIACAQWMRSITWIKANNKYSGSTTI